MLYTVGCGKVRFSVIYTDFSLSIAISDKLYVYDLWDYDDFLVLVYPLLIYKILALDLQIRSKWHLMTEILSITSSCLKQSSKKLMLMVGTILRTKWQRASIRSRNLVKQPPSISSSSWASVDTRKVGPSHLIPPM